MILFVCSNCSVIYLNIACFDEFINHRAPVYVRPNIENFSHALYQCILDHNQVMLPLNGKVGRLRSGISTPLLRLTLVFFQTNQNPAFISL